MGWVKTAVLWVRWRLLWYLHDEIYFVNGMLMTIVVLARWRLMWCRKGEDNCVWEMWRLLCLGQGEDVCVINRMNITVLCPVIWLLCYVQCERYCNISKVKIIVFGQCEGYCVVGRVKAMGFDRMTDTVLWKGDGYCVMDKVKAIALFIKWRILCYGKVEG